jgi:hydroxyacylglutathione hydrolase
MLVARIFIDNPLRNYHYLVACPETGEALALDPLEPDALLQAAADRGWTVRTVVCTHEHWDHSAGREDLRRATGARVLAHHRAPLEGLDGGLRHGDVLRVGTRVELRILDTPGHTRSHVCLVGGGRLFSGDTVFVAGCGNCLHGGDPEALWTTFTRVLADLDDGLVLEPGHDYAINNLRFALDRDPGNDAARAALQRATGAGAAFQSTLGEERTWNPFFRLGDGEVRAGLGLAAEAADRDVFLALRERRNRW